MSDFRWAELGSLGDHRTPEQREQDAQRYRDAWKAAWDAALAVAPDLIVHTGGLTAGASAMENKDWFGKIAPPTGDQRP